MNFDALIVIDVQTALLEDHPYQEEELIGNIRQLLAAFRDKGTPVIYVQHEEQGGPLERGTPGWEIAAAIAPQPGEPVFAKHFNSSFRGTGLHEWLQQRGIHRLLLCGMQTEYCVDTSCKVAFELGYEVTIPRGGTSTFDNGLFTGKDLLRFYENYIWEGAFARVIPMGQVLAEAQG